jgi:hypothetical protein
VPLGSLYFFLSFFSPFLNVISQFLACSQARETQAMEVSVSTFVAQNSTTAPTSLEYLKNLKSNLSCMPNQDQVQALFQACSPWVYFHPNEEYLPSSVSWYFTNGALLYNKDEESKPMSIESTGSSLPQGGSNFK